MRITELIWRKALGHSKTEEERKLILEHIGEMADHIGAITVENIGDPATTCPEARRFYAEAVGWRVSSRSIWTNGSARRAPLRRQRIAEDRCGPVCRQVPHGAGRDAAGGSPMGHGPDE